MTDEWKQDILDVFAAWLDGVQEVPAPAEPAPGGKPPDARKNIPLGTFCVEGLEEEAPGGSEIVIRMDLDLDGILTVEATEKATGLSKDIRIENSLAKLSEEQIREAKQRIADLFPATDAEDLPVVPEDEPSEDYQAVRSLIFRAEALLDSMDRVDREDSVAIAALLERDFPAALRCYAEAQLRQAGGRGRGQTECDTGSVSSAAGEFRMSRPAQLSCEIRMEQNFGPHMLQ